MGDNQLRLARMTIGFAAVEHAEDVELLEYYREALVGLTATRAALDPLFNFLATSVPSACIRVELTQEGKPPLLLELRPGEAVVVADLAVPEPSSARTDLESSESTRLYREARAEAIATPDEEVADLLSLLDNEGLSLQRALGTKHPAFRFERVQELRHAVWHHALKTGEQLTPERVARGFAEESDAVVSQLHDWLQAAPVAVLAQASYRFVREQAFELDNFGVAYRRCFKECKYPIVHTWASTAEVSGVRCSSEGLSPAEAATFEAECRALPRAIHVFSWLSELPKKYRHGRVELAYVGAGQRRVACFVGSGVPREEAMVSAEIFTLVERKAGAPGERLGGEDFPALYDAIVAGDVRTN